MNGETIFVVKKTKDGMSAECKITDGGVDTVLALISTLEKIKKQLAVGVFLDLKEKGLPIPTLDKENKKLYEEVATKLKTMTPDEAEQFIKDIHGLLVKGK